MSAHPHWVLGAACGLGLVLTLVLAGWLTPRHWWRRPTAGNVALVGGGTLAFGALFAALFGASLAAILPAIVPATVPAAASPMPLTAVAAPARVASAPPSRYRVVDDLNLRAAKATGAPRLAVLPAGTLVTPTGAADGDWWQVRARLGGRELEGWASSLWLRRVDEGRARGD
jgi:hypothetical protein